MDRARQHLLGDAADSSERGWVELTLGMFERDRAGKRIDDSRRPLRSGSATMTLDLAFAALAYLEPVWCMRTS